MKFSLRVRTVSLALTLLFAAGVAAAGSERLIDPSGGPEARAQQGDAGFKSGRGNGRLAGKVTDLEGNPLPGIEVRLVYSQIASLSYKTATNKKGDFSFPGLGSGYWNLTAFGPGFDLVTTPINVSQVTANPPVRIKLKRTEKQVSGVIEDQASIPLLDEGRQLYDEKKFGEALARFEEFLAKNPSASGIRVAIADCRREMGELEKAELIYGEIIERAKADANVGPDLIAKALLGLGDIRVRQSRLAEARELFQRSIGVSPQDEILAYNVGEIFFSGREYDEAVTYFRLAARIKPDWPDPYLKLGYVHLSKAENAEAITQFEKFLTLEGEGERAASVRAVLGTIRK